MSLGYAEKLSFREDLGGRLGDAELFDNDDALDAGVERLAALVAGARRVVAFTGAGISTSAGIPDFRGPNGVWTRQRAGLPPPRAAVSFALARPTLTHAALAALLRAGKLTYIVSQNVDSLHLRSGVPRARLAELHGNCFAERCGRCGAEHLRDFEVETVGFKYTGRRCPAPGCGARLRDSVLDWEDALPEAELAESRAQAAAADLAICLGTSLQITPACDLPLRSLRATKARPAPGRLAIVNLQRTKHDRRAEASGGVVVRARADDVMRRLCARLGLVLLPYVRQDRAVVGHAVLRRGGAGGRAEFAVFVRSAHGDKCPMPMVVGVEFRFSRGGGGAGETDDELDAVLSAPPFVARRTAAPGPAPVRVEVVLRLHEAADADKRTVVLHEEVPLLEGGGGGAGAGGERLREVAFVSQVVEYDVGGEAGAEAPAAKRARVGGAAGEVVAEPVAV